MRNMSGRLRNEILRLTEGDDTGKIAVITGANSGIGFEATRMLAERKIKVVMACRNGEKAVIARQKIVDENPEALLEIMEINLASQKSVREFSGRFKKKYNTLNILVNNAGVMATPYGHTEDGYETQFGTNHLGHFTLTGLLLENLLSTPLSRVVTISSIAHFRGSINFNDVMSENSYSRMVAYRQSKLANLLFAYELDRRLKVAGKKVISVAAHPGISSTNIVTIPSLLEGLKELVLMSAVKGALPTVMGAVDPNLSGGEFIGPDGPGQAIGYPAVLKSGDHSYNKEQWLRLWSLSEELTGTRFKI